MAATDRTPLDSVNACWARIRHGSPVYNFFLENIEVVSATKNGMVAKLTVHPNLLNSKGTLHGSVSATIVDWAGGMAIAAATGLDSTGLSVDIHVTYISTAKLRDKLTIEADANKVGKNLGFTTVKIWKGEDDDLAPVATGTHTKYILRDVQKKVEKS